MAGGLVRAVAPIAASGYLSSRIVRHSCYIVYPGGDHGLRITQRDRLNAELLAFLASESAAT